MAIFVLVHGAWHGGWCWRDVAHVLTNQGHQVLTPTLTGMGEREHLGTVNTNPDLHVNDICQVLHFEELKNVILVGHSYGGNIITGVADRQPDRLKALVYFDAAVPDQSGEALLANAQPERIAQFEAQLTDGNFRISPDYFDVWTDDTSVKAKLKALCTTTPVGCFTQGVTLHNPRPKLPRHYMLAAKNDPSIFQKIYKKALGDSDFTTEELPVKHAGMCERPNLFAARLMAYAATLSN